MVTRGYSSSYVVREGSILGAFLCMRQTDPHKVFTAEGGIALGHIECW